MKCVWNKAIISMMLVVVSLPLNRIWMAFIMIVTIFWMLDSSLGCSSYRFPLLSFWGALYILCPPLGFFNGWGISSSCSRDGRFGV